MSGLPKKTIHYDKRLSKVAITNKGVKKISEKKSDCLIGV